MKTYLLLRDNRETGPYSYEQLAQTGLRSNDLIWIENESICWAYAKEIPQCISLINRQPEELADAKLQQYHPQPQSAPQEMPDTQTSLTTKEKHTWSGSNSPATKKPMTLATVLAVIAGVMVAAPLVKNIVDYQSDDSKLMPVIDRQEHARPSADFKKAIVREIIPVYTQDAATNTEQSNKKTGQHDKKTKCRLAAFDGINGVQLTVFNTSSDWVDKALVSLDYLKPDGDIIKSENLVFTSIKPHQAQTIDLSSSMKGVQLRYMLLKVYSHKYKLTEKHI